MPVDLSAFSEWDFVALALLLICWQGIGWRIEHSSAARPSTSRVVAQYRRDWMVQLVTRQPRIFDSAVLATLREGTSFFASACMLAIGGGLALLGNTDRIQGVASEFTDTATPDLVWEVKILVLILLLASGFLAFVWSHRLFGYCAVVMASVPNDPNDPSAYSRAAKAAEININAARSFNRGLRAVYFSMAALTWLLGGPALILGTLVTVVVLWRREFGSASRAVLKQED
ncbi:MAG: DUF599 domain-containing protein [Maritimibacter sp.]